MKRTFFYFLSYSCTNIQDRMMPVMPSNKELNRLFGSADVFFAGVQFYSVITNSNELLYLGDSVSFKYNELVS